MITNHTHLVLESWKDIPDYIDHQENLIVEADLSDNTSQWRLKILKRNHLDAVNANPPIQDHEWEALWEEWGVFEISHFIWRELTRRLLKRGLLP
jgi:hypothetical protein